MGHKIMEMMWMHTLTIVISMAGLSFWVWHVSKNDSDKNRQDIKESAKRYDAEFQETRKLWANLLQKSAEIEKENAVVQQEIRELMKKL